VVDLPPPHLDTAGGWLADLKYLCLLVLVTVGLRCWQLTHTSVTARDSISYIRIAWNLEHGDWRQVIPKAPQHPGYPVAVRIMSVPVRYFVADLAEAMQLSAQLVSALASVLLIVPLYYLGRELFARNVAFWGVLLFQCLPPSGRIMADGLSEPLFLLFTTTGLALALRALRTQWVPGFALAGLASGAAYLTRPEGAVVAVATAAALLIQQLSARRRRRWPVVLKCGAALSVGVMLLAGPFMLLIGRLTLKPTPNMVWTNTSADGFKAPWLRPGHESAPPPPARDGAAGSPRSAAPAVAPRLFAVWWDKMSGISAPGGADSRRGWAAWVLGLCLVKGLFYVGIIPLLFGLWRFRDRFGLHPGALMLLLAGAMLLFVLYRVAVLVGYLSERHLILVTMVCCFWVAAGTVVIGRWLAARGEPGGVPGQPGGVSPGRAGAWTTGLLALLCFGPAVRTLDWLHGERAGFREAGCWLAHNSRPGDTLVDPYTWASYYAGRVFQDDDAAAPAHEPPVCYVVLDESNKGHTHLEEVDQAEKLAKSGREVGRWKLKGGQVAIYEVTGKTH
jgi:hypothetical protein